MSILLNAKNFTPNLFTLANLACGFSAIIIADFRLSPLLIVFSLLFDALDGFVARKLNVQSDLGKELDSLADLTSFGVAPAYLYYLLSPLPMYWAIIPPVILVLGSALRLAKFNLLPPMKYFKGLPTPATAYFMIGLIFAYASGNEMVKFWVHNPYIYSLIPLFFTILMLSRLPMFSLKGLEKNMYKNVFHVVMLVVFIALLIIDSKVASPLTVLVYILLCLLQAFTVRRQERKKERQNRMQEATE